MKEALFAKNCLYWCCFLLIGCQMHPSQQVKGTSLEKNDASYISVQTKSVFLEPILEHTASMNPAVQREVESFQSQRHHINNILQKSKSYKQTIIPLLRENGVPEDLIYVVFIESGFNGDAVSPKNAVGYWQFIESTGRFYGLTINESLDERKNLQASTLAAIKYFKNLYNLFKSWELSLAAYNAGENRIKKTIWKTQQRNFLEISKKLPKETARYVPKFYAMRLIDRNPQKYGFLSATNRDGLDLTEVRTQFRCYGSPINCSPEIFEQKSKRGIFRLLSDIDKKTKILKKQVKDFFQL